MGDLTCPFCNPPPDEILLANDLCYARYDKSCIPGTHNELCSKRLYFN